MPVIAQVAMKFKSQELAAEVAARAAEMINSKADFIVQFIDNIRVVRLLFRSPDCRKKRCGMPGKRNDCPSCSSCSGDGSKLGFLPKNSLVLKLKEIWPSGRWAICPLLDERRSAQLRTRRPGAIRPSRGSRWGLFR